MRKILCLFAAFLLFISAAVAQSVEVNGRVADEKGVAVAGASVQEQNSRNGTITDANGQFKLAVKKGATLRITSVGYDAKTVTVGANPSLSVVLTTSSQSLSEVVVTGVGVATSKKKLAISVESISGDKLPAAPTASIDQALVGKIAGAQISSANGSPGRPANIVLRGINSVRGGTMPMVLMDGVEVRATDLQSLDLTNVDRIEVVQGAASATIYGAQGANGVIQLFSKKGKAGKIQVNFSSSVATNEILNNGGLSKARLHPFAVNANGEVIGSSGSPLVLDPAISRYRENVQVNLIDPNTVTDKPYNKNLLYYDHYKMFLQRSFTTNNSVSVSGARENVDFNISASDNRQNSNFRGNGDFSRSNLTSNFGVEVIKNLKFRTITQLVYTKNTQNDLTGRGIMFAMNNSRPFANYDYRMPDGNYGYYFGDATGVNGYNPNYRNQYSNRLENKVDIVQNFNLNYKPFRFVELDVKYGINHQSQDEEYNVGAQDNNANASFNRRWWTGFYFAPGSINQTGEIDNFRYRTTFKNFLSTATFTTDFQNDFNINLPIKTTTQVAFDHRKNNFQQFISWGGDAPSFTPYRADRMINYRIQSDRVVPFVTYGYLVNQRFEYKDLMGVSGGVRSDYSSAFGGGSKPFTFPRGDAFFRVSQMNFWKENNIGSIMPEFKLRAAYGEAGIQPFAFDRYLVLDPINMGNGIAFTNPVNSSNPALNVEHSKELEFGTDINFRGLKGSWLSSINLSATYWKRSTDGALWPVDAAPSTGIGRVIDNAFGIASEGLQASLNTNVLDNKKFSWNFTANFGRQSSEITSVKGNTPLVVISNAGSSNYILKPGEKIGQLYGYLMLRSLDQKDPDGNLFIPKSEHGNYTVASNGWVVDKATRQPYVTPGQYNLGDPNPKFNMSFINDFSFKKGLHLSMQWDWLEGNNLYNQTRQWMYRDGIHSDYAIPLTIDGQTAAYTAFYRGVYAQRQANGTRNYFFEDASFVRLRNLSFAVDVDKFIKVPAFKKLQVVFTGRNLVTFTKYTGMDPEVSSGGANSAWDRGVDHNTIPNLKTFQAGINVGF